MKLKSVSKKIEKERLFSGDIKASYALFIEFLKSNDVLDDYLNNVYTQDKIEKWSLEEMRSYVLGMMEDHGAKNVLDYTIVWSSCGYPEDIPNRNDFWSNLHKRFRQLHIKFEEEVLNYDR